MRSFLVGLLSPAMLATFMLVGPPSGASPLREARLFLHELNLAKGCKATASSVENFNMGPEKAVDGIPLSRWSSAHREPEWLCVDLGRERTISAVAILWAFGREYEVQVSGDGKSWRAVAHRRRRGRGLDVVQFEPVRARFVRVFGLRRGKPWGFSIHELMVFERLPEGIEEFFDREVLHPKPSVGEALRFIVQFMRMIVEGRLVSFPAPPNKAPS